MTASHAISVEPRNCLAGYPCRVCGREITAAEATAYGGGRCELCWCEEQERYLAPPALSIQHGTKELFF